MRPTARAERNGLRGASGKASCRCGYCRLFGLTKDGRFQGRAIALALPSPLVAVAGAALRRGGRHPCAHSLALAGAATCSVGRSVLRPQLRRALPRWSWSERSGCSERGPAVELGLRRELRARARRSRVSAAVAEYCGECEGTRVLSGFGAGPALGFCPTAGANLRRWTYAALLRRTDFAVERECHERARPRARDRALRRARRRGRARAGV